MMNEKKDLDEWIATGLLGVLFVACASLLVFAIVAVTFSARSSGSPDYCVVGIDKDHGGIPTYWLWAHRPWSMDMRVGAFLTFNEAAAASERIACPFRSAP